MYRRILVPVDGSPISHRAVGEAAALARAQGAGTVRLLYVTDETLPPWGQSAVFRHAQVRKVQRESGLRLLRREAQAVDRAGVKAETQLLTRKTYPERIGDLISDHARRWRADLIVMGSHGRGAIGRVLMGSVAQAVVRGTDACVLLVQSRKAART